jgi:hypothetical protein
MEMEAPVIMINLSYNLNNYKQEKKKQSEANGEYEEEY